MRQVWSTTLVLAALVASLSIGALSARDDIVPLRSPSQFDRNATTIDFEGMPGARLTDQIPGLHFSGSELQEDGTIESSKGIVASAASSGKATVFTSRAEVTFDSPVTQVGAYVSPSFISVPLHASAPVFAPFTIKAYDADGNPLGEVTVPVLIAVGPDGTDRIENFRPVFIGLESSGLIYSIVITRGDNGPTGGATLRYDDLTFTPARQLN